MRRLTLTLLGVLAVLNLLAQDRMVAPSQFSTPQSMIDHTQAEQAALQSPGTQTTSPFALGSATAANIVATKIGEASNAFASLSTGVNQITHITGSNFMVATYRNNASICGGASGNYRYSFSTDLGATWDVAAGSAGTCFGYGFMNPAQSQAGRYPNVVAYLPTGETSVDSIDLVYAGWTHDGVGGNPFTRWTGSVVGVINNATTAQPNAPDVAQEDYPMVSTDDEGSTNLVERVSGEYWIPSPVSSTNPAIDGNVNLWKGEFNDNTGVVDWNVAATLDPNHVDPSNIVISNPVMGFGPTGQAGIVAWLGDVVAPAGSPYGSDSTLTIVYSRTGDGGATWGPVEEIPMATYPNLIDSLENFWITVLTNGDTVPASGGAPTTGFDLDVTVDANGNPHLVVLVGSGSVRNEDGSRSALGVYSIYSGFRKFVIDWTPDPSGQWNGIVLGSPATFRGEFTGISLDNYVQASRSEDGTKVFLSWTDTDTTGNFGSNENLQPDLFARAYDVNTGLISDVINWTDGDASWDGQARMPTVDPIALFDGNCLYTVPTMVSEFTDGAATTGYWYFSNIEYDACNDITLTPNFLSDCANSTLAATPSVNQPSCGATDGSIDPAISGGSGPYIYSWSTGATTPTLTGVGPGTYTLLVTDAEGCTVNETFQLQSVNAPTATAVPISDVSCFGAGDGSATFTMSGGTAPYSFDWANGETDSIAMMLPPGTTEVTITDASGCVTFAEATVVEPEELLVDRTTDGQVTCAGDSNGAVSVNVSGGNAPYTYNWDNGATGQSITGLVPGDYLVTVTDANGCETTGLASVEEAVALVPTVSSDFGVLGVNPEAAPGNGTPYNYTITLLSVAGEEPAPFDTTISNSLQSDGIALGGLCAGTYEVVTEDQLGCTAIDTVTIDLGEPCALATSIKGGILRSFNLYPNPTTGVLHVAVELPSTSDVQVEVVNTQGQVVASREAANVPYFNPTFDLSDQAGGIYLLRVSTPQGTETAKVVLK